MKDFTDKKSMIRADDIVKTFGKNEVLRGVSLEVSKGEIISIIGPSGSGKSTFLRSLIGLEQINGGSIYINGIPFVKDGIYQSERDTRPLLMQMGMVFQHFNLFPHLSVRKNLTIAPSLAKSATQQELDERCAALLETVGLADKIDEMPSSLSGGQKQRVAIARALMMEPELLLFDEPTSALDPELTGEVLAVIKSLASKRMTMIIVTHEMSFARDVSDRVIFMDRGLIAVDAPPSEVFENSDNERIRQFLRSVV